MDDTGNVQSRPRGRLGRSSSISKLASNFESPGDSETASQPPSSPSRGDGAAIVANARRAEAVNAKFQKTDLNQSVARILLNDEFADANVGAFATLDLSDNGKFKALEPGQKNMLLRVLARGARVEELALNNLGLDNRNAAALGEVLRGQEKLRSLSLDANALSGPGLKSLAADFKGHPTLSELSLDNQCNGAMMPNDAARLIVEATEATPALIVLKLGHLRDSGLRYRLQTALSAHTELVRQKRHRISMGEEGGSPSNVRQRRGSLGGRQRNQLGTRHPLELGMNQNVLEGNPSPRPRVVDLVREAVFKYLLFVCDSAEFVHLILDIRPHVVYRF